MVAISIDSETDEISGSNNTTNIYRLLRLARGKTVSELSRLCGLNQSYISQIEAGKKKPSVQTKLKLAEALRVSPALFDTFTFPEKGPNFFERALLKLLTLLVI